MSVVWVVAGEFGLRMTRGTVLMLSVNMLSNVTGVINGA